MNRTLDTTQTQEVAPIDTTDRLPLAGSVSGGIEDATPTPEEVVAAMSRVSGSPVTIRRFTVAGTELVGFICPCHNRGNTLALRPSRLPHVVLFVRATSPEADAERLIAAIIAGDATPGVFIKDGQYSENATIQLPSGDIQVQALAAIDYDEE